MKKNQKILFIITLILILLLIIINIWSPFSNFKSDKLNVVTSFYPLTFLTEEIGGQYVAVNQLIPDNMGIHSWSPSTSDMLKVNDADLLIYNGGYVDLWIETNILPFIDTERTSIVKTTVDENLIFLLESEDSITDENLNEYDTTYDPHTWLSPFVVNQQALKIFEALVENDFGHEKYYIERWENFNSKLEKLDHDYFQSFLEINNKEIFVAHAAYGYLADRYGLIQHGIIGISADEQPDSHIIVSLVEKMIQHEVYVLYTDPLYSDEYVQTLKNELENRTGKSIKLLKLYLMTGYTDGMNYLEQQEKNLENLKIGFGLP